MNTTTNEGSLTALKELAAMIPPTDDKKQTKRKEELIQIIAGQILKAWVQ